MSLRIWDFLLGSRIFCWFARDFHLKQARSRQAVVKLVRPQCGQLFLMYAGMDAYMPGDRVNGLYLIDFLRASRLGDRNLTWIKDPYLDDYRQGIGGDAPTRTALEAWHREHIQAQENIQEVYTLGYSSGAYGALYFGHVLGVKKVWAFSPRTATRKKDAATRAELKVLLSTHNGVTEYEISFAAGNKQDRTFAEMLAGCPGVTIRSYEECGSTHFLLHYLAEKDQLRSMFPDFVGAAPVSSSAEAPHSDG